MIQIKHILLVKTQIFQPEQTTTANPAALPRASAPFMSLDQILARLWPHACMCVRPQKCSILLYTNGVGYHILFRCLFSLTSFPWGNFAASEHKPSSCFKNCRVVCCGLDEPQFI